MRQMVGIRQNSSWDDVGWYRCCAIRRRHKRALDDRCSHKTGNGRFDGIDPLDTVVAYNDMTELVIWCEEM